MIPENIKQPIISIWDKFIADHKKVQDVQGNDLDNIDEKRIEAILKLKIIIENFLTSKIAVAEFKTSIDSFNKLNNLWGFTSIKGQMFFNLLLKNIDGEDQLKNFSILLKANITEPTDLADALSKIEAMESYTSSIFKKASDKRKAPNPGSICYFLSYFWQIHNYQSWPVMYSSIIVSFNDIGLWQVPISQKGAYNSFFNLNEEIKQILSKHTGRTINNWEAEHAFWNFRKVTAYPKPGKQIVETLTVSDELVISVLGEASFNIYDFIPPITARLIDLGDDPESSSSAKGSRFEKAVCEVFKQLGFSIQSLGQGYGREPDLIAIHKEENVAFIVDAKAYPNGYMLSASDERAIREYISNYSPKLKKEGINKIGFLIVSNSFKAGFETFINDVTWKTDVKRFSLISSDALLHLLAYKIKDQLHLSEIIDAIISLGNSIAAQDIIQKFDDI